MAGLGYVGAGGVAGLNDSLEQMVAERYKKQLDRQRQEQLAIQNEIQRKHIAQADRRIGLDEAAAQERAEMQRATLASLQSARDETSADKLAADLVPGSTLDPGSVSTLQKGNRGGLVQHDDADLPSRALSGMATATADAPTAGPLKVIQAGRLARDTFKGTDAQRMAKEAAADKVAAREDAQRAAIEMQRQRAEDQANQARLVAGLRGGNQDLQRELLQGKIDAAKEKETEKQRSVDTARNAAMASIDDTVSALDELIDDKGQLKPGAAGAFGADSALGIIPGTSYADARSRRDRLQSRLTIDLLGELKRQSRTGATGFGALTEKELAVVQNAAARLQSAQSDESARQALVDVRKKLTEMRQRAAGGVAPATSVTPPKGGFKVVEIK